MDGAFTWFSYLLSNEKQQRNGWSQNVPVNIIKKKIAYNTIKPTITSGIVPGFTANRTLRTGAFT
jgi:hypothetical protein